MASGTSHAVSNIIIGARNEEQLKQNLFRFG
jgi:hypothetical protein